MKKIYLAFSILITITSCEVLEKPFNTVEDCAGIIGGDNICGCTDINAFNYNNTATFDDSSCIYSSLIYGCTDSLANNYNLLANTDDGSCGYSNIIPGCTDSLASNYNIEATEEDYSCIPYIKNVLIEDFTGHLCPNCPDAARELDAIHDIYGEQIIGMAIHVSKSFARPYPPSQTNFQYDFRTYWGHYWDNFYGVSAMGLPRGMVNRIGYPDNHKLGKDEWASAVAEELTKELKFGINIKSSNDSITISSRVLNNISGGYNIVVCLTESNIINWQKDGQENVENYTHNHVLKAVLIDDVLASSTSYITGEEITKKINYDLASLEQFNIDYSLNTAELGNGNSGGWNTSNMSVIAYIYDNTTKEIIQVEEAHLNN